MTKEGVKWKSGSLCSRRILSRRGRRLIAESGYQPQERLGETISDFGRTDTVEREAGSKPNRCTRYRIHSPSPPRTKLHLIQHVFFRNRVSWQLRARHLPPDTPALLLASSNASPAKDIERFLLDKGKRTLGSSTSRPVMKKLVRLPASTKYLSS